MARILDFSSWSGMQVDIETYDPNLQQFGSGVYRKDGMILGVAIGDMHGKEKEYYPLAHPDTTREEEQRNLAFLKDALGKDIPKLGANIKYDLDWLVNGYGIQVNGSFHDIQLAEPLLDEYRRSYSLESLARYYLDESKTSDRLYEWCIHNGLPVKKKSDAVKFLKDVPSDIARTYALGDVDLPGRIFRIQSALLDEQNLTDVYDIERRLIPMLLQMRKTGVRIDKNRMIKVGMAMSDAIYEAEKELNRKVGRSINVKSPNDVKWLMDKFGLEYPRKEPTAAMLAKGVLVGNPQLDKNVLASHNHWVTKTILDVRHLKTLVSMFIHPYQEMLVGDRLHCDFNQLKSDEGGTVSGRFSSCNPNLQQVASRSEGEDEDKHPLLRGKVVRDFFIPEEDHDWLKHDWSQIEYRFIAHYARGPKSEEIRRRYREDPSTDYHDEAGEMTGLEERKIIKTLNFGTAYGMGPKKMAVTYGWDLEYAYEVFDIYHKKLPFVRYTSNLVANKAKKVGYVRTILGRRSRLVNTDKAYVMFNRLIQGSAADIMKKAMLDSYNKGLFDVLPVHLTVHDELDNSKPRTKEGDEAAKELKYIMENCVKLDVPIIADAEIGPTWGTLQDY